MHCRLKFTTPNPLPPCCVFFARIAFASGIALQPCSCPSFRCLIRRPSPLNNLSINLPSLIIVDNSQRVFVRCWFCCLPLLLSSQFWSSSPGFACFLHVCCPCHLPCWSSLSHLFTCLLSTVFWSLLSWYSRSHCSSRLCSSWFCMWPVVSFHATALNAP